MKLRPDQLRAHLSKNLSPVYLISGDEPLLVIEAADTVRGAARKAGFGDRQVFVADRSFDWQSLTAELDRLSLFASRRLVELRLPTGKPGTAGAKVLTGIARTPPPDTLLIVSTPKLDKAALRSKWVTSLANAGAWVVVHPVSPEEMPAWVAGRMRVAGLSFDDDAASILAARTEGNLLAAKQEIDKLVLLADTGHVGVDTVEQSVADGARFNVFQLADAAVALEPARALRILNGLRREATATTLVLWALAKEVTSVADLRSRVDDGQPIAGAMAAARIWKTRQRIVSKCVARHDAASVSRLLQLACQTDRIVKGARYGQPWNALADLTLALARPAPVGTSVD